jgi:hypothetical protein
MSNEDPYRPNQGRDRGAYTPPTDDDLPFNRGGYDARRPGGGGGGAKAPPMTLIISGVVLLLRAAVVDVVGAGVVLVVRAHTRSLTRSAPCVAERLPKRALADNAYESYQLVQTYRV